MDSPPPQPPRRASAAAAASWGRRRSLCTGRRSRSSATSRPPAAPPGLPRRYGSSSTTRTRWAARSARRDLAECSPMRTRGGGDRVTAPAARPFFPFPPQGVTVTTLDDRGRAGRWRAERADGAAERAHASRGLRVPVVEPVDRHATAGGCGPRGEVVVATRPAWALLAAAAAAARSRHRRPGDMNLRPPAGAGGRRAAALRRPRRARGAHRGRTCRLRRALAGLRVELIPNPDAAALDGGTSTLEAPVVAAPAGSRARRASTC